MDVSQLNEYYRESFPQIKQELFDFLRFQSISTDPAFEPECIKCAKWVAERLHSMDFNAELIETSGLPLVIGHRPGKVGAKHLVFYGHYDVQPVDDPEVKWKSNPFEPIERDEHFFARGAQDNKGQLFYVVKAIEALVRNNILDASVTILIEGQEESGSDGLNSALPGLKERLKADVLLVCDTGMIRPGHAAITVGLRGIIALEAILHGPSKDLHSGVHGGLCKNPAQVLNRLVANLHDADGRITVPGYYDGIPELTELDRKYIEQLPWSDEFYQHEVGIPATGGEKGLHPWVRRGLRPTLEINGQFSGYTGEGGKTIIPEKATVKLSSRLVGGQNPQHCLELLKQYFQKNTPAEFKLTFGHEEIGGPAVRLSPESACVAKAIEVLRNLHGMDPDLIWEGASIPIVSSLAELTNGQALLVGYGLESDNIHAPNENFAWERFRQGFLYAGSIFQALA